MREKEAREELARQLIVTRQLVTLAKVFLLHSDRPDEMQTPDLISEFAKLQGYEKVNLVVLHPNVNPEPHISQASGFIRCELAFVQALWELIHADHFMYWGQDEKLSPRQGWTTVIPNSGGTTGGWVFDEFSYVLPYHVVRGPYWRHAKAEPFMEPDIFVLEAGINGADQEIVEALQDAVGCLRYELYRPAVTLLGKAMEGAWIELGIALASALPNESHALEATMVANMQNENKSIARKIRDVVNLYKRSDLLEPIIKGAGISSDELQSAVVWSDVVREGRNAIHFGVKPAIANSYEKVVVLLLEGAKSLGMMYQIKRTAEATRTSDVH